MTPWRGTVAASAILLSREAESRALALWQRGVTLYRLDDGLLLRFPTPRWMRAGEAPGEVFVEAGGILTSAQLEADEARQFRATPFVRLVHGEIVATVMPSSPVQPHEWIDVSDFHLFAVSPLAEPVRAAQSVAPDEMATPRELFKVAATEDQKKIERELMSGKLGGSGSGRASGAASSIWLWLRHLFRSLRGAPAGDGPPRERRPTKFGDFLRSLWNRALLTSRLARILGEKQAAYMAELVDMLEGQRFDEALRHAIPLSDRIVDNLNRVSFGIPKPRTPSLSLFARPESTSAMIGSGDLTTKLRELYRAAAQHLERAGKIEDAAYVLADLLNSPEEAVSLLERHGRLELAAKLAEARKLAPDLVVRQWFVAGDRKRAVAIARRYEAFELAVRRLERTHADQANALRIEWAESLASRGDFGAACDVLWPIETERERARSWLETAIRRGGVAGGRALVRKLSMTNDAGTLEEIGDVLAMEDEDEVTTRLAIVTALREAPDSPRVVSAISHGLRALIRDIARHRLAVPRVDIDNLTRRCGDGVLRADLPPMNVVAENWRATPNAISLTIAATDRGVSPIFDAALLERNLVALALGEAGCILIDRNGRTVARFDQPAHRLAVSDRLDRGIAIAQRNESLRLAKLDFAARTAKPWVDARLDFFADSYDGATWYTGFRAELSAIDATSDRFESIWYNPEAGPFTYPFVRTPKSLAFITEKGEAWQYETPTMTLRSRSVIDVPADARRVALPDGRTAEAQFRNGQTVIRAGSEDSLRVLMFIDGSAPANLLANDEWIVVVTLAGEVHLLEQRTGRVRARVHVQDDSSIPSVRLQAKALTVFDGSGRLVVLDLERGAILRDQRI